MRLNVFRSLTALNDKICLDTLRASVQKFDGVELRLSQLLAVPPEALSEPVLCAAQPADAADAGRMLDALATHLARNDAPRVELVMMKAPTTSLTDHLEYLDEVFPLAAAFLEAHPTVGSAAGRLTAHGNALPPHVYGVCHELDGPAVPRLSEVCDVYSAARLSLSAANLCNHDEIRSSSEEPNGSGSATAGVPVDGGGLCDELDCVLACADHLYVTDSDEAMRDGGLWEEVGLTQP